MRRLLRGVGWTLAAVAGALAVAAAVLFLTTSAGDGVPPTVAEDPTLPTLEVAGYAFHAEAFGDPAAPVAVVLHGGPGGDYRSLQPLEALSDAYRVVFYDQRGSGLSPRVPQGELTYEGAIADLHAIVTAVSGDRPVVLIGHSWGAMLASGFLGRYPELVDRAVLIEPGYLSAAEAAAWNRRQRQLNDLGMLRTMLAAGFGSLHLRGPDAYARQDFLFGDVVHAFENHPDNPYHCPGEPYDAPSWRFGAAAMQGIRGSADTAALDSLGAGAPAFERPVLFLAGSCDTWIGPEAQAEHAALFPRARLEVVEGAGHEVVWDRPDAALERIRDFLEETGS